MEERKITMKNIIILVLTLVLLCAFANAETIYVTISDGQGKLALAYEAFEVSDTDADGAITICDALVSAHEAAYAGGAEAGFKTMDTDYGISLQKLWGEENGGSYGYYVNNASAYSLTDPIQDGDSVHAFAYTDLESWTDTYSYFDCESIEIAAGEEIVLQLSLQLYDANWNTVVEPVSGAEITINGENSASFTDESGNVRLTFDQPGKYIVSAVSETINLVPPVCIVNVK